MTEQTQPRAPKAAESPRWGPTIKLVVALTFVAIIAGLLMRFNDIIGPLLLAFILAYVLHPLASFISKKTRLSWKAAVNLIFLTMLAVTLTMLTITGVAIVQEAQNLVVTSEVFIADLPAIMGDLSTRVFEVAGYRVDMGELLGQYDWESVLNQVVDVVQPVLGRAGSVVGTLASSTVSAMIWGVFIFLIAYFTLADTGEVPQMMNFVQVPAAYEADIRRLGRHLGRIWNAFMRGQLILFTITVLSSFTLLTILGVSNSLALALLAGFARFIPYIGPFIMWAVAGMVAFFQTGNYLGLEPFTYSLIVVGASVVLDQIFDTIVTPRLYGQTLGVHPAAVLVAAIVAANIIGFVGLLLAAPVLATLTLFGRYALRKMFDLPPWAPGESEEHRQIEFPGVSLIKKIGSWVKLRRAEKRSASDKTTEQD